MTDKRIEKWIWIGSAGLFCIGYFMAQRIDQSIKSFPIRMGPVMSLGIVQGHEWLYMKMFNNEPVDTFWSMDLKRIRSGVFNVVFWLAGLLIPILISYELIK